MNNKCREVHRRVFFGQQLPRCASFLLLLKPNFLIFVTYQEGF